MITSKRISLFFLLWFVSELAQANPLGMTLMRTHAPEYAPGLSVEIVVTIDAAATEGLQAMGVYETLPDGWRFGGVNTGGGGAPVIMPVPGEGPRLEFAWIVPPVLPCSFSYKVLPSEDSWGVKEIHGLLEYRLKEGPYYLPDTVTALTGPEEPAPSLELHGEQVMEVVQGDVWEEPGYTALDAQQQDISSRVVVTGEVLVDAPGTYTLRYTVASASGTKRTVVERVVRVLPAEKGEHSEPGAGVSRGSPFTLPANEARKLSKTEKKVSQTSQKDQGRLLDHDARRDNIQLPAVNVLCPFVSVKEDSDDTVETASEMREKEAPVNQAASKVMERQAQKQPDMSGVQPIPNGKTGYQHLLDKSSGNVRREYGFGIIGLAGVTGLGVIGGAWLVYRSGGRRRLSKDKQGKE